MGTSQPPQTSRLLDLDGQSQENDTQSYVGIQASLVSVLDFASAFDKIVTLVLNFGSSVSYGSPGDP